MYFITTTVDTMKNIDFKRELLKITLNYYASKSETIGYSSNLNRYNFLQSILPFLNLYY
jgi:hypothetical protein